MKINEHETDVLVVGSGFGGCMAACVAAEKGVNVAMVTKSTLLAGGSARAGFQGGINYFPKEEVEMYSSAGEFAGKWKAGSLDELLKLLELQTEGLCNLEFSRYVIENGYDMLSKLESYGVKLTSRSIGDKYMWTRTLGGMLQVTFDDWEVIQPKLGKQVSKFSNINVFERMMTVELIKSDNEVNGVIAFDIRTGDIHVFYGKTVILATGSCSRLYETPANIAYNTRYSPFNTGDSQAMALRAGAELANMEILFWSMCPKDFEWCGTTWSTKMGAVWRNAKGERIMDKAGLSRHLTVLAVMEEIIKNNGPVFLDFTDVPDEKIDVVYDHISYPLKEHLKSRGIDLKKGLVEYVPHGDNPLLGGVTGGISVNVRFKTPIERLYAIGNTTNNIFGFNAASSYSCVVGGMFAGDDAAAESKSVICKKDKEGVQNLVEKIKSPLGQKGNIEAKALENNLRRIMSGYVGYGRNEKGLTVAIDRIKNLKSLLDDVKVEDARGLMKYFELKNLMELGEGIAESARFRNESRLIPCHYRSDFPEKNDEEWYGKRVAVKLENNAFKLYKIPTL